jgi:hypothetical protein
LIRSGWLAGVAGGERVADARGPVSAGTTAQVGYLTYPRLAGVAERGWSPAAGRSRVEYRPRLAAQGPRWTVLGVRFHRDPDVPWRGGTGGETTAPADRCPADPSWTVLAAARSCDRRHRASTVR